MRKLILGSFVAVLLTGLLLGLQMFLQSLNVRWRMDLSYYPDER